MTSIPRSLIIPKLTQLDRFLDEFESVLALPYEKFKDDFTKVRTAERDLQLLIEFAADIVNQLLLARNLPPAGSYKDTFRQAAKAKIITTPLAARLIPLASLRNRLVHEYDEEYDPKKAYEGFRAAPEALREFAKEVFALISEE